MRPWLLAPAVALLGACAQEEYDWLATRAQLRGVRAEVVEPGGYASLLNVPPGRPRATPLPLDTVELEWHVAAPPGAEVPPPIWLVCGDECIYSGPLTGLEGEVEGCPEPLPLGVDATCRLGEGHRLRVGLAGAYTVRSGSITLLLVGSREADLESATCLERLTGRPRTDLAPCIIATWDVALGPEWALLPFDADAPAVPPEIVAQEVDVNPEVIGLEVARLRGGARDEFTVDVGASVGVRRGDRLTVAPIFAPGSAQEYWILDGGEQNMPWSGEPKARGEELEYRAWFDAPVRAFDPGPDFWDRWTTAPIHWTVPDDVEPTRLYLDVRDGRQGRAFAELLFVADTDP